MRIVVLTGGFELCALVAEQSGDFAGLRLVPRRFSVVGLDHVLIRDDELGVIAIGETSVESVGAGFAVRRGEGTFDRKSANFGDGFRTADGFDVLVDDFLWILGMRRQARKRKCQAE